MRIIEVQVGKKTVEVVAGLEWHPLIESGSARNKEVLNYAKQTEADLKILRGKESVQVGLAKSTDGAKAGQVCLAAMVADALAAAGQGPNALVALQIPGDVGKYLHLVINQGMILTDGDVVDSRDKIRSSLTESFSFGGWDTVVCPGEWGISDSLDHDFDVYVNAKTLAKHKPWRLKPLQLTLGKFLAPLMAVVLIAGVGIFGYKYWQEKKSIEAFQKQLAADQALINNKPAPSQPEKPWPLMPTPSSFVDACQTALNAVGLDAGNWQLNKINCSGGSLSVVWVKASESAWISHLVALRPSAVVSPDGLNGSVTVPAPAKSSEPVVETLIPQTAARLRLYDLASRYRSSVSVVQVVAPAPTLLPGQMPAAAGPAPAWNELSFTFITDLPAAQVASFLSSPGLRLKQLDVSLKAGTFQYTYLGVQYVQP